MVNVLERRSPAVLHAYPELVPAQVGPEVLDDVGVSAVLHHQDLLLDDAKVVAGLQLDHLDGGEAAMGAGLASAAAVLGDPAGLVDVAVGAGPDPLEELVVILRVSPRDVAAERGGCRLGHVATAGAAPDKACFYTTLFK